MKRESKYASCLNALDEMQQSVIYAARKGFLAEAESIIVRLESETAEQRAEIARLQAQLATEKRYQELVNYIAEHDDGDFSQEIRDEAEQYGLENLIKLRVELATAKEAL